MRKLKLGEMILPVAQRESWGGRIRTQTCYSIVFWSEEFCEVPAALPVSLPVSCQARLAVASLEWLGDCEI